MERKKSGWLTGCSMVWWLSLIPAALSCCATLVSHFPSQIHIPSQTACYNRVIAAEPNLCKLRPKIHPCQLYDFGQISTSLHPSFSLKKDRIGNICPVFPAGLL